MKEAVHHKALLK